jgi:hypothetical protein
MGNRKSSNCGRKGSYHELPQKLQEFSEGRGYAVLLHCEELHNQRRRGGACSTHEIGEECMKNVWSEKYKEEMPLGRPGRSWENVKIDFKGTGWEGVNCIYLPRDGD